MRYRIVRSPKGLIHLAAEHKTRCKRHVLWDFRRLDKSWEIFGFIWPNEELRHLCARCFKGVDTENIAIEFAPEANYMEVEEVEGCN